MAILNITKGHDSVNHVAEVKVLVLFISTDNALYLYHVCKNIFNEFKVTERTLLSYNKLRSGLIL